MDTMYWTTCQDHNIQQCDKLFGFMGGLKFVSMKWKTTTDDPISEEEAVPGTSGTDTTNSPENIESTYNLRPRKPKKGVVTAHQNQRAITSIHMAQSHHQSHPKSPLGHQANPNPNPSL